RILLQQLLVALDGEVPGLVLHRLAAVRPQLVGRHRRSLVGAAGGTQQRDEQRSPGTMHALSVKEGPEAVNVGRLKRLRTAAISDAGWRASSSACGGIRAWSYWRPSARRSTAPS